MIDAGELRDRMAVMTCECIHSTDGGTDYLWKAIAMVWGKVELGTGSNLFSRVGIGARDATITLRDRKLDLHQALRWGCYHLFLTSLVREKGYITAKAAVVHPTDWATETVAGHSLRFPGVLTEKYLGYQQQTPMVDYTSRYVLVTPKTVTLEPSDLVATHAAGVAGAYIVEACHILDPHKNEYEIVTRKEL